MIHRLTAAGALLYLIYPYKSLFQDFLAQFRVTEMSQLEMKRLLFLNQDIESLE